MIAQTDSTYSPTDPTTWARAPNYVIGLDIGMHADPSAYPGGRVAGAVACDRRGGLQDGPARHPVRGRRRRSGENRQGESSESDGRRIQQRRLCRYAGGAPAATGGQLAGRCRDNRRGGARRPADNNANKRSAVCGAPSPGGR
jgi:hypothetical protein